MINCLRSCLARLLGVLLLLGAYALGGVAHAQLDLSYQGVIDLSYGRFEPSGQVPDQRLNSNSLAPSFIGGTVKYGFDGGFSTGLVAETFIRFQDLKLGRFDDDPFLSRNAFVFVNSPYGNVRAGRMQTYLFDATTRFNALGNSVFSPATRHLFLSGDLESIQGDFYWDQGVSYSTPTIEGITANVMYARGTEAERGSYGGGSLIWSPGLFSAVVAGQNVYVNDGIAAPTDERTWQLGLSYNFSFARVFFLHSELRDRGVDVDSRQDSAGVSMPLGPGTLLFQGGYTSAQGPAIDRWHQSISAAYLYSYDSQTDFYVIGMDDRIRNQTEGLSMMVGVRYKL